MLINDHVVTDFLCNLRCDYCPCEVTLTKRRGNVLVTSASTNGPATEETVAQFLDRNIKVITLAANRKPTPVLKVSGGELFLVPEFLERLPALAKAYGVVQILTNGTRLDPQVIEVLKAVGNVHLQVSLDGHTLAMNNHRFKNQRILDSILAGLATASASGIPLEVNTVLSQVNTGSFFDFVRKISSSVHRCTIYPFPVRSNPRLYPSAATITQFVSRYATDYSSFETFLPPRAYMNALVEFLTSGIRSRACYVPEAVVGSHGDGTLEACTCGPVKRLGNVLDSAGTSAYDRIGVDSCYAATQDPTASPSCCRDCFTHYDIVNLFIEGQISVDEIERIDLFTVPEVLREMLALRAAFATARRSSPHGDL